MNRKNNRNDFIAGLNQPAFTKDDLDKFKQKQYQKYMDFYRDESTQEYFLNVVAAILLAYRERYPNCSAKIPCREKSPTSIRAKLDDYIDEAKSSYNDNDEHSFHIKPIKDAFAMKFISLSLPPIAYSPDSEIQALIDEKNENTKFLGEMQKFNAQVFPEVFSKKLPKDNNNTYSCTKLEYFNNCKRVLEQILTLTHANATNLNDSYKNSIDDINNCISIIEAMGEQDSLLTDKDIHDSGFDFKKILKDFNSRINDRLDLTISTKQFNALFESNDIFDKLGISLNHETKEKRTKSGYVSNFIYLNTLLGTIECQIQSNHEYEEGNHGYSAHHKLRGKAIIPKPIPNPDNKEQVKEYIRIIRDTAPQSYVARMDCNENERITIQKFSDYNNYKNLVSQVTKGDPSEKYLLSYFGKLYAIQSKIFKSQESTLGFIPSDIEDYIASSKFADLKGKSSPQFEITD